MQNLISAYVLHRRPYRETSFLVDVFGRDSGRLSGVVRGARGGKSASSRLRLPVEPFRRMRLTLRGRGQLRSIDRYEIERTLELKGDHLIGGFYLNEVLTRVLETDEPMPRLFDTYESALAVLAEDGSLPVALRSFEKVLLEELGYGIDFHTDLAGQPIGTGEYRFRGDGFESAATATLSGDGARTNEGVPPLVVPGAHLAAIDDLDFTDPATARSALKIFRRALRPHLGDKPLQSRELLTQGRRV